MYISGRLKARINTVYKSESLSHGSLLDRCTPSLGVCVAPDPVDVVELLVVFGTVLVLVELL
jgi:hypothetical protein